MFAITTSIVNAQDLVKVKGNREVTTEISPLNSFEYLEISGDYEIEIVPGVAPQIEITTDSNLHQYLAASVVDGKLVVTTTARIRSKKEMKFRIVYGPELNKITVTEDAQLSSVTSLTFDDLELNIKEDAEVYMTANVARLNLYAEKSTNAELNLTGKTAVINLEDNAEIKALIKYSDLELNAKDRIDARIEGDVDSGIINLKDRSSIEFKNLVFDKLDLKMKNNTNAQVNVKGNFYLESTDDAEVSLYGSPSIKINKFTGKSVIRKQ
ncbi:hypothetical protein A9Q93_14035 [Nonlabens dokdonensis]|uniref:Putative auto-transporter adhesin head GIN domain-containing protein n=1 Tax=Nonlabens dokdonensis TaxID=328515 RepID=A0A1Z8AGG0_9FLAO|nr:DUF2807 domain-containing protein [Nonlabens dokdonensis]OUS09405.1 hypothetical protein A9Q93_14035 [Nonlabens dokdonensis]